MPDTACLTADNNVQVAAYWPSAAHLLRRAIKLYDAPGSLLPDEAKRAARSGFPGGAAWMALGLSILRERPIVPASDKPFSRLGITKYLLACLAATACIALAIVVCQFWLLPIAALAFYAVEVQMVFLFPFTIDGAPRPFSASRDLVVRSSGTLASMAVVVPIAAFMLFGAIGGQGLLRSWCVGCLAICIWYEDLRTLDATGGLQRRRLLDVAGRAALLVRHERVLHAAGNPTAPPIQSLKLLYVSDLHLGRVWTRLLATELPAIASATNPAAILLGGDLVDCERGLTTLRDLISTLSATCPVYAVGGNHDKRVGLEMVRSAVIASAGFWLPDQPATIAERLRLFGTPSAQIDGAGDRVMSVLCAHDPAVFASTDVRQKFDLVLAGHLHGGQCVLYSHGAALYPGSWFNRWTVLRASAGERATLIVSRGAGDTLPVRWNCPREAILLHIDQGSPVNESQPTTDAMGPGVPEADSVGQPPHLNVACEWRGV